jgi:hypothetical protein
VFRTADRISTGSTSLIPCIVSGVRWWPIVTAVRPIARRAPDEKNRKGRSCQAQIFFLMPPSAFFLFFFPRCFVRWPFAAEFVAAFFAARPRSDLYPRQCIVPVLKKENHGTPITIVFRSIPVPLDGRAPFRLSSFIDARPHPDD